MLPAPGRLVHVSESPRQAAYQGDPGHCATIGRVATLTDAARAHFRRVYGVAAGAVTYAPGRVNLIGDHTDYNEGFVLPMAIGQGVAVAFAPRTDLRVRVYAAAFDAVHEFGIETLAPGLPARWPTYVEAVVWSLQQHAVAVSGLDLAVDGDLPIGAGLASSAALEIAVARAVCASAGVAWDPLPMARAAQRAETEYVGVPCGIMDQLAAAEGRIGQALLVDCRSLDRHAVSLPAGAAVVVIDSGVARALASSAYRDRRRECERAVEAIRTFAPQVRALRDVDVRLLAEADGRLDPTLARRVRHVVDENRRPAAMAHALASADLAAAGQLMNESHRSLRDLYEVSCAELDAVVDAVRRHPACYGARMTGAGFGGCVVALVDARQAREVVSALPQRAWIVAGVDQRT